MPVTRDARLCSVTDCPAFSFVIKSDSTVLNRLEFLLSIICIYADIVI